MSTPTFQNSERGGRLYQEVPLAIEKLSRFCEVQQVTLKRYNGAKRLPLYNLIWGLTLVNPKLRMRAKWL